ncbi:hypothetical protein Q6348_01475 [Isoptericola sp. b441]|uniref:Uncharacterized protein n=1 Tax=Actinotalea lenta TaxID=3064654 RepID=A0ABT9D6R4_9CELL|nr:hypothetical protein [Isoptericola sp. b441]MDO8105864.1 hypothetical protein [Isoptericola sp. b441]
MATTPGQPVPAPMAAAPERASASTHTAAFGTTDATTGTGSVPDRVRSAIGARARIPLTVDPLGLRPELRAQFFDTRAKAVANLFTGMAQVHADLGTLVADLAVPTAPANLIAVLVQPDGSPVGPVQIQFDPATLQHKAPVVSVVNERDGGFRLPLPAGMRLPTTASLHLVVHGGSGGSVTVDVPAAEIAANGVAGTIRLGQFVTPLPVSILASLQQLVAPAPTSEPPPKPTTTPALPVVSIGDGDSCLLSYGANASVDRFRYGVFFRLVEPRASIVSQARPVPTAGGFTFLPFYATELVRADQPAVAPAQPEAPARPGALPQVPPADPDPGSVTYVDRVPVEQPISVDGFRDQVMGLTEDGTYTADELRPMAGTLGIGYVLHLSQQWTLQGLALGDLVYSLPLAPGEQQQVAVFERTDTARVTESEFFTQEEAQHQRALSDTSTHATFESAFEEAIHGSSHFDTHSSSKSWGASIIIVSGGGGSSSASGSSSQTLEGHRQTTQEAAQQTHSAAENQASARRRAARTGMRVATATESQELTTRVITNHNHTRALTMQYWEVQRLYDVTTGIDGLTLAVLVPLQVVRFMPPGQPVHLTSPSQVDSRAKILQRYEAILKHADVLGQALPRRYQHGLQMLTGFAADPLAAVSSAGAAAQDIIQVTVTGSFLDTEDVWLRVVTDRGTRIGPVKLTNPAPPPPAETFESKDQLVDWLMNERRNSAVALSGAVALPPSMNRSNVVGFELSRAFASLSYPLLTQEVATLKSLEGLFGGTSWIDQALESKLSAASARRQTVVLTPADLERAVGGPHLTWFSAAVEELADGSPTGAANEEYANQPLSGVELPQQTYPVPARQLAPVLRYDEVLEIEKMAGHVARNTLTYSHAVWASMDDLERAVLLEAYTIGVPPDGVEDATQMVPLLNCVQNRVLGFFGNSMILPFIIPQSLSGRMVGGQAVDPIALHDALLAYQKATFSPPHSTIALPTRGVLAEAVLGTCPSAEKIDLRRFWNWQDSPADTAPTISPVTLPTGAENQAGGLTAPSNLTNLPSLINNVLTAPTPDTSLLSALSQAAAGQKDFASSLTGASELAGLVTNAQNTANLARADALKTTKELNAQAMATVGNILGGIYGGNPTAGSSAAAAVSGKGDGGPAPSPSTSKGTAKPPDASGGGKVTATGSPGSNGGTPSPSGGTPSPSGGTPSGGPPGPPTGNPSPSPTQPSREG